MCLKRKGRDGVLIFLLPLQIDQPLPAIQVWLVVVLDWHCRRVVCSVWQWNPCAYSRSIQVLWHKMQ